MRYAIAFALLALTSTAFAQQNQFSLAGVTLLPGSENTYNWHQDRNLTQASDPGYGLMLRYERLVGFWSIGFVYEHLREGGFTKMHQPALWTRFRAGDRFGFYLGLQFGAVRGSRSGFAEDELRGFHAGGMLGFDARFRYVGFMLEAGYQLGWLHSHDTWGRDEGYSHTPVIRAGLTFVI